ncbi:hypothetical protein KY358_06760 [Candidatus Woesearchaeota archaeon]|nr:hypothetical protein [Candidatus Woesearchaeota archaeon]
MKNKIVLFGILVACILLFGVGFVSALPGVADLNSSSIGHGESLAISGMGFGEKSSASPVVWDTLEDGSCDLTADINSWSSYHSLKISDEAKRHENSEYCAYANMGSGKDGNAYFTGGSDSMRWFVQYWFKLHPNWTWGTSTYGNGDENLANVKIFRIWSTSTDKANYVMALWGWANDLYQTVEYIGSQGGYIPLNPLDITLDEWHLMQFEFSDSTDLGVADGTVKMWYDGKLIFGRSNLITRDENNQRYKRPFIVGFYDSWDDSETDDEFFYIDDAYIDNSFARVEIGDNESFDMCTHHEIQIPTSWSDDEIVVNVNRGSFEDGETAYVFVVDEDGTSSEGYPVTFSSETGGTTPPTRSNPQPSGTLPAGTTQTTISLETGENAECRYSTTAGIAYGNMADTFTTTGGMSHSQLIEGLQDGQSYAYYARCSDTNGNFNTDDLLISFSIETDDDADTDKDGKVSLTELIAYITRWKRGEVDMLRRMEAVGRWLRGE